MNLIYISLEVLYIEIEVLLLQNLHCGLQIGSRLSHIYLERKPYNVVCVVPMSISLRKLMRSGLSHTLISFLVILVVSLGTSFAGSSFCPPGYSDCEVVVGCCAEMENNSMSETRGAAEHSPVRNGCSHEGICLNVSLLIDVSAASGTFTYDNTLVLSHLSYEVDLDTISRAPDPPLLKSPIEKFPPLYLRICSFLI